MNSDTIAERALKDAIAEGFTEPLIADFAAAFAIAQGQMKHATFDRTNSYFKSKYATLAAQYDAVREALSNNDISIQAITYPKDNLMWLQVWFLHKTGSEGERSNQPIAPISMAWEKPQEYGARLTYARRYAVQTLCGISADEDDDAESVTDHSPASEIISPDQVAYLQKAIVQSRADPVQVLKMGNVEKLEFIPARKYEEILQLLRDKYKIMLASEKWEVEHADT